MYSIDTRRFPRYYMHTPVFIPVPGTADTVVPGLVSRLSRTGMEVYAGVNLRPGEVMEVECFGLEICAMRVELGKATARC